MYKDFILGMSYIWFSKVVNSWLWVKNGKFPFDFFGGQNRTSKYMLDDVLDGEVDTEKSVYCENNFEGGHIGFF